MTALQQFVTGNRDAHQTLVVIFLRGGADGLNMVAPLEDDGYYRARPRIAISKEQAVPLDDFFGLNPLLQDLAPIYKDGQLAVVHAAGSEDDTRSHFEAQDLMEHAGLAAGGWLGRYLRARPDVTSGPLASVAVGRALPESLRGAPSVTVMESFQDFSLGKRSGNFIQSLKRLYRSEATLLGPAARDTLGAIRKIEQLSASAARPEHGAEYGRDAFSEGLRQIAQLIKARVGLEAATIDLGGWDSHTSQGFIMDPLMTRLAKGLLAFYRDLGQEIESTSVIVMTEFGRRLAENSAFGTDHGRGSVLFVMGGGVRGGRVFGHWPGLSREVLEGPGDLPVTTNYRNVLAPVLLKLSPQAGLEKVFPGFSLEPMAVYG